MLGYGADAAPAVENVVSREELGVCLRVGEDTAFGGCEGLGDEGGGAFVVVKADYHSGGLGCGFVQAVGSVVEDRNYGVRVVLTD